jgi:hypothetical protein
MSVGTDEAQIAICVQFLALCSASGTYTQPREKREHDKFIGISVLLLWKSGNLTMEINMEVLQKSNIDLLHDPMPPLLSINLKELKSVHHVYSSTVHNSQILESV